MERISSIHWRKELVLALSRKDVSKSTATTIFLPMKYCETEIDRENWAKRATKVVNESKTEMEMINKLFPDTHERQKDC